MKPTVPLSRVLLLLLIGLQAALYGVMWIRVLDDPSLKTMDFLSFYGAGRLARTGEYEHIYDAGAQANVQQQVGDRSRLLPFIHPVFVVPVLAVIAVDNYVLAYVLWSFLRVVIVVACGELIRRFLLRSGWDSKSAWLGMLGCVLFFPVFISILGGQDTVFTLIALLVWMFALLQGSDTIAGLGLALSTLSPTIAGALALPLFASRRRASIWFIAGIIGLVLYTLLLVGTRGIWDFVLLLRTSSQTPSYGYNWPAMYNLWGILARNLHSLDVDSAWLIVWGAALLSILAMCILWWNKQDRLGIEHMGIGVLAGSFTSPHLHLHALSILILPLLGFITVLWNRGHRTSALLFTPVASTALMLIFIVAPDFSYAASYVLMAVLAYGLCSNPSPARRVSAE